MKAQLLPVATNTKARHCMQIVALLLLLAAAAPGLAMDWPAGIEMKTVDWLGASASPVNEQRPAAVYRSYTYDAAGRLTQADYGEVRITYTYDAGGNLLQREVMSGTKLYLPLLLLKMERR